jgi:hypothetical protein
MASRATTFPFLTERKKQMAGKLCFSTRVQHLPETFLSDLRKVLVEACR